MNKHNELIENLRGIRKIVINKCHGGFGLSHAAILRYHELSGTRIYWKDIYPGPKSSSSPKTYHLDAECTNQAYWSDRNISRDDPVLIRVVEELGNEEAGNEFAMLQIVRIPADVDWIIQEYDGMEWIAERHRTWQ